MFDDRFIFHRRQAAQMERAVQNAPGEIADIRNLLRRKPRRTESPVGSVLDLSGGGKPARRIQGPKAGENGGGRLSGELLIDDRLDQRAKIMAAAREGQ